MSSTRRLPAAATARAVRLATPESLCRKLSAVRSAPSSPRALPSTFSSSWPTRTASPSSALHTRLAPGSHWRKASCAQARPASTPSCLAINCAPARADSGTTASEVASAPAPSSASARRTVSATDSRRACPCTCTWEFYRCAPGSGRCAIHSASHRAIAARTSRTVASPMPGSNASVSGESGTPSQGRSRTRRAALPAPRPGSQASRSAPSVASSGSKIGGPVRGSQSPHGATVASEQERNAEKDNSADQSSSAGRGLSMLERRAAAARVTRRSPARTARASAHRARGPRSLRPRGAAPASGRSAIGTRIAGRRRHGAARRSCLCPQ